MFYDLPEPYYDPPDPAEYADDEPPDDDPEWQDREWYPEWNGLVEAKRLCREALDNA